MHDAKEEVLNLEKRFWEEADNPELFRETFADDGLTIMEPMGYIEKPAAMKMSGGAKPFKNVKMSDVHMRELTPDCIAVAYHGEGIREGDKKPYRGSICSIYVRRNGNWQLAIADHQPWQPKEDAGHKQ